MSGHTEANRCNALVSTGPKTPEGKAQSSKNALRHGLSCPLPVLPGLERAEDWADFRAGILESLAPVGTLEEALAERVALCSWRLQRVARYETAATAVGLERIAEHFRPKEVPPKPDPAFFSTQGEDEGGSPEISLPKALKKLEKKRETAQLWEGTLRLLVRLPGLPDEAPVDGDDVYGALEDLNSALPGAEDEFFNLEDRSFLAGLGIPEDELSAPFDWAGWTAGMVRKALLAMARKFKTTPEKVLARAAEQRQRIQAEGKAEVRSLQRQVKELRERVKAKQDRLTRERILPDGDTLQKVSRYEAHLSRQLYQALHELQRLQAARAGQPVPPPAALDVTVDADTPTPALPAPGGAEAVLEGTGCP
jgi:hypothetical protein